MLQQNSYTRITLALDIVRKIADGEFAGFHELNTVKHQIKLHDTIWLYESDKMEIVSSTKNIPINHKNICWQVVDLIKKEFCINKNVRIELEKNIPVKGGLAGGSTNAAVTFQLLNSLWNLNLSKEELIKLGRRIGMDIPFYFHGKTAFDTESSGILYPIKTNLNLNFLIYMPKFGVSTKDAYSQIDYSKIAESIPKTEKLKEGLLNNSLDDVAKNIHNDFELSVFKIHPQLAEIKENMLSSGALAAFMSGSGSTMVALCETEKSAEALGKKIGGKYIVSSSLN